MILDDEGTHSGGKERDKHTRQSQRERGEKSSFHSRLFKADIIIGKICHGKRLYTTISLFCEFSGLACCFYDTKSRESAISSSSSSSSSNTDNSGGLRNNLILAFCAPLNDMQNRSVTSESEDYYGVRVSR
jgi:hypothetical protein